MHGAGNGGKGRHSNRGWISAHRAMLRTHKIKERGRKRAGGERRARELCKRIGKRRCTSRPVTGGSNMYERASILLLFPLRKIGPALLGLCPP
jgi:hypothetical protein